MQKLLDIEKMKWYYNIELAIMREIRKGGKIMQTNMMKLRGKIAESGMKNEEFASKIGMNPSTFYRKMKANGLAFTVGQMQKMVEVLGMSTDEAKQIFLQ